MNLKGKKVLITGATGGIGNSLVAKFSSLGAAILATGTNEVKLENLNKKFLLNNMVCGDHGLSLFF